jgi:hypothetical protein
MIKFLILITLLLVNCKESLKEKDTKSNQNFTSDPVICKDNPRVINNELFCINNIDSTNAYYQLRKWEEGKWEKQIDSIYVFQFFEFTDVNLDSYRDLAIFYKRGFSAYLYNPLKKKFENESVGFNNSYELIDSINSIYCNSPVMPYDERSCNLFKIVDYKQQYKYVLVTSPDVLKNGKYEHVLYKVLNNQLDSLKEVKIFYDKYDYMSFDYTQYWKALIKTSLYKTQ